MARHQPDAIPPNDVRTSLELDTILININLDIHVRLFSLAATYGVTDRLDVGILVPVASVDMDVKSKAEIITSPENPFPRVHSFVGAPHGPTDAASDDADGIGDIVLRAKYLLLRSDVVDIAGEVLTKLETGDERNFLGTGKTTVRPFLIFSRTVSDVFAPYVNFLTPPLNLGYE